MKLIKVTTLVKDMVIPLVQQHQGTSQYSNSNSIGMKAFHSYPESDWFRAYYPHSDLEAFAARCLDASLYTLICNGVIYIQMRNMPINNFSYQVKDLFDQHMAQQSELSFA